MWANPGMNEYIIADLDQILETADEIEMFAGDESPGAVQQRLKIELPVFIVADPIAFQRLFSADTNEEFEHLRIAGQRAQKNLFVIAR